MSSTTFAHILFLLGLNLINVLCQAAEIGPSGRFASRVAGVPSVEFNDILQLGGSTWYAADGLYVMDSAGWRQVLEADRITALAADPSQSRLAYAGSGRLGIIRPGNSGLDELDLDMGFVWALEWVGDRIWIFGSERYGWVDSRDPAQRHLWNEAFSPRPLVSRPGGAADRLFVGSAEGLWEITTEERRLVLPAEQTNGNMVPWVVQDEGGFLLGTVSKIYRWSGNPGQLPEAIPSNYADYFQSGLNNAVVVGNYIAITEYPRGVALWDVNQDRITGYISGDIPGGIGDVYKIRPGGNGSILILGDEGVGRSDLLEQARFVPLAVSRGASGNNICVADGGRGHVFIDDQWLAVDSNLILRADSSRTPDWIDLDSEGHLVHGANNGYEQLVGLDWEIIRQLPFPLLDLKWGKQRAYALGVKGIYSMTSELDPELILPEPGKIRLLGEYDEAFYVLSGEQLIRIRQDSGRWQSEILSNLIEDELIDADSNELGLWLATSDTLYQYSGDKLNEYPVAAGWRILALSTSAEQAMILYGNPDLREWAVGVYRGDSQPMMLSVPYKDHIGEPIDIMNNASHTGVVGTGGIGWYALEELPVLAAPKVDFALLFENRRIEDRTIPSGMHFIDLQVIFDGPAVPSIVEYRINDGRWRDVNLRDPSLQFAGHGSFSVELRAVHPNGNASASKLVQFGIAPPWYLNPIYQGVMLVLAIVIVWILYFLRSRQLKRTNLWLQNEVKKQTRELEAATSARTNFLAGLSHDIRNPLNGVLMIAETLSRNPPERGDDPRLKDLTEFGIIVDRMLGEILDFSAIDEQKIPTSIIPVSISDIIESSVKQNQFGIQHGMVTLETDIEPELKEVIIRTDRNWMIKVLSNLIVNALEYSESPRVEVAAKCRRLTESEVDLELQVSDWGIGIDDSEKPFIFERFYRGESGIESGKHGTGLGLSICQEIAHAMGGHIRVENNEPSGSRFVLTGRFERVEDARELDQEAVLEKLRGKRILIVDDLVYNRKSIVGFFETIGCSCDQAENGREALSMLESNSYHLALLDWDLPGLTGPEIARRYRKGNASDPVILIAVTAYTDGEKKRESEEAGMNGYISKPLTASRLAHCLANLESYRPEKAISSDVADPDEVLEEIYKHIDDCLLFGEHYEWESLRRCAHRLTTLAMIKNNRAMQQVCRDLQIFASEGNIKECQIGLLELRKWKRP